MSKLTLPTDSAERKNYPLLSGCLKYFPAAIAGIARISKLGNDKHNPGQDMHHARGKSSDHSDCIVRHLVDTEDMLAALNRGEDVTAEMVLTEASQLAWRALAYSQELHEKFGAPLAPGAKVTSKAKNNDREFQIGRRVKLPDSFPESDDMLYPPQMEQDIGKVGIVVEIGTATNNLRVQVDGGPAWWWKPEHLTVVV